jgi:uncharacterized protein (TIGR04141 family)
MPRPPRLRTLSVFLLREEIASWDDALRHPEELDRHEASSNEIDGVLVVGKLNRKKPWWRDYVARHVEHPSDLDRLLNSSTGAVFLFATAERRFAIAFGQGRHLLDPDGYEQDFGLRVVLNSVDPNRIRSVDARTIDESTMHTRVAASRESDFEDFGLDVARDLVRAVAGPPRDETLGRNLAGADRLAISTRAQLDEVPELADRLLSAYESEEYKERYPWVDRLRPVRDKALISDLDDELISDLRSADLDNLHLAPPEALDPLRLAGFDYSTSSHDDLDTDPRISAYLKTLDGREELSVARLKSDRVLAYESEGEQLLDSWKVFDCIVYETGRDDLLFVLSGGQWFQVNSDFQRETIDYIEAIPSLDLELPEAPNGIEEKDYNRLAAQEAGVLNLDRQLVKVAGQRSEIELCDLFSQDRQLVHVKRRGYSSTLSHHFAQGAVSARLLRSDQTFRQAAKAMVEAIDPAYAELIPDERPSPEEYEISYAVITRATPENENPLTLPFFSLVNLAGSVRLLRELGFRVSVAQIREA